MQIIGLHHPQLLLKPGVGSASPKVPEFMVEDIIQIKVWMPLVMAKQVMNIGYGAKNVHSSVPKAQLKVSLWQCQILKILP